MAHRTDRHPSRQRYTITRTASGENPLQEPLALLVARIRREGGRVGKRTAREYVCPSCERRHMEIFVLLGRDGSRRTVLVCRDCRQATEI